MWGQKAARWTRASDIMVTQLYTLRPEQPVGEGVRLLLKRRVSGAPVIDGSRTLVGIFSEKDGLTALLGAVHHERPPALVSDVMTTRLITVTEDTHVMAMAHLFTTKPIRRLPVVRDGRLVGQVSRRDLLNATRQLFDGAPSRESAVLYLSALGELPPV